MAQNGSSPIGKSTLESKVGTKDVAGKGGAKDVKKPPQLIKVEDLPVSWISNNGLRVRKRTQHSIILTWASTDGGLAPRVTEDDLNEYDDDLTDSCTPSTTLVLPNTSNTSTYSVDDLSDVGSDPEKIDNFETASKQYDDFSLPETVCDPSLPLAGGPWFEVQMKSAHSDECNWATIYRGYSSRFEVKNIRPNTSLSFRYKRSNEEEWGSVIVAATDSALPTAEELHRALSCNAVDMVLRILGVCKPAYLRRLLATVDRNGQTALTITAANSNPGLMTIILDAGAEINFQPTNGTKTALMVAASKGDIQCADMLTKRGANWCIKDRGGLNSLHYAVISGSLKMLEYCLKFNFKCINDRDEKGWTPLLRAIVIGLDEKFIRTLLFHGANANATDRLNNKSCLMVAASKNAPGVVRVLLEYRANPLYRNSNGTTALDMAKGFGTQDAVEILERAMKDYKEKLAQAAIPNTIITAPFIMQVLKAPEGSQPQKPSTSAAIAPAASTSLASDSPTSAAPGHEITTIAGVKDCSSQIPPLPKALPGPSSPGTKLQDTFVSKGLKEPAVSFASASMDSSSSSEGVGPSSDRMLSKGNPHNYRMATSNSDDLLSESTNYNIFSADATGTTTSPTPNADYQTATKDKVRSKSKSPRRASYASSASASEFSEPLTTSTKGQSVGFGSSASRRLDSIPKSKTPDPQDSKGGTNSSSKSSSANSRTSKASVTSTAKHVIGSSKSKRRASSSKSRGSKSNSTAAAASTSPQPSTSTKPPHGSKSTASKRSSSKSKSRSRQ